MSERAPVDAPSRRRRALPAIAAVTALVLALGVGALVTIRGTAAIEVDVDWMAEIIEHRTPILEVPSRLFDLIGGGVVAVLVVPIGVAVALLLTGRRWGALYWLIAVALSAAAVQGLKALFDRARPEDILVVVDPGSFPSGHTANAATVAVVLALVLRRRWATVLGLLWLVAMALSRTYLGAHWVTDTIGGTLVGAAVAVLLWTLFAARLRTERMRLDGTDGPDWRATADRRPPTSGAVPAPEPEPSTATPPAQ